LDLARRAIIIERKKKNQGEGRKKKRACKSTAGEGEPHYFTIRAGEVSLVFGQGKAGDDDDGQIMGVSRPRERETRSG